MTTAHQIIDRMVSLRDDEQRAVLMRFFKTGVGEYGHCDEFLGIKVPATRQVVKQMAPTTALSQVPALLMSPWHEVRLCGLLIMVDKFQKLAARRLVDDDVATAGRDEILAMYLDHAERANNWDLVDLSAPYILGRWLLLPTRYAAKQQVLDALAASDNLWRQRMSMVCTWMPTKMGDPSWCLRYAAVHLRHPHDLMHKAVGWMLREMGKRVSMDLLRDFLARHVHEMPRTALRYAIEKMPPSERHHWLTHP